MKYLTILLILIACSCSNKVIEDPIILGKRSLTSMGNPMPNGICRFFYQSCENCGWIEFQDSCHFYFVGDKLSKMQDTTKHRPRYNHWAKPFEL